MRRILPIALMSLVLVTSCQTKQPDPVALIEHYGCSRFAPVQTSKEKLLRFQVTKIEMEGSRDFSHWQVQFAIAAKGKSRSWKCTRTISDNEPIGGDDNLNYTLVEIKPDEKDPENTAKMNLVMRHNPNGKLLVIPGPQTLILHLTDGKDSVDLKLGDRFTLFGSDGAEHYTLLEWNDALGVATVRRDDDKSLHVVEAKAAKKR